MHDEPESAVEHGPEHCTAEEIEAHRKQMTQHGITQEEALSCPKRPAPGTSAAAPATVR